ncbi:hypothetical protein [Asaia prunellae]|uniref:hypothetical protein n=1 Tax=Asaia prunellae TaxID=610245 RepID=UPI000AA935D5|nr:hypothetical protein [Asaia prunellae]
MFAPIRTGLAVIFAFHAIPVISSLAADAHETRVMCSGGFSAALQRLAPVFEKMAVILSLFVAHPWAQPTMPYQRVSPVVRNAMF